MVKIITIDLDGTLFDKYKNVSEKNRTVISEAKKRGIKIVIATGRPLNGILYLLDDLGLNTIEDFVICYNGAKVVNAKTHEVIYSTTISGRDVKKLYNESRKLDLFIHAFKSDESLITAFPNEYTDVEKRINKIEDSIVDFNTILDDEEFLKMMLVDDELKLNVAQNEIDSYFYTEYTMVRSAKIFLEFLNKKSDKGLALEELAKYLNIDMKETMAIGDAGNDISMIKRANIGVAMENAFKEVLEIADDVTTSNENDGVANAIIKHAFN